MQTRIKPMITPVPIDPSKLPMHLRPMHKSTPREDQRPAPAERPGGAWSDFYGEFDGAEL